MVKYKNEKLDATFSALADPTRRSILARLSKGGAQVTELAEPFGMSLPAVSKHLRVLEKANLIKRQVDGRVHWIQLKAESLKPAFDWIEYYERFWTEQLQSLQSFLERNQPKEKK